MRKILLFGIPALAGAFSILVLVESQPPALASQLLEFVTWLVIADCLSIIAVGVTLLVVLASQEFKMARSLSNALLLLFLPIVAFATGGIVSLPFTIFTSVKEIEATKKAALPIIAAAEKFCAEKGAYPAKIADLIPVYITAKPRGPIGIWGMEYQLHQTSQGGFVLEFSEKLGQRWEYDSGSREWKKVMR